MDLSLRGSQINLSKRSKKPKPILTTYQRPFSASSSLYRGGRRTFSRSSQNSSISSSPSVFLSQQQQQQQRQQHIGTRRYQRPISADTNLTENNCIQFSTDKFPLNDRKLFLKQNKKFFSNNNPTKTTHHRTSIIINDTTNISSSDLLNLLLNETINRRSTSSSAAWSHNLKRSDYRNYSDSGYRSDCSLGEKIQKRATHFKKSLANKNQNNKNKSLRIQQQQDKKDTFYKICNNSGSDNIIIDEENLRIGSSSEEQEQDNPIGNLRFSVSKTPKNFKKSSTYDNNSSKPRRNLFGAISHRMNFNNPNNNHNNNNNNSPNNKYSTNYTNQLKYSQEKTNSNGAVAADDSNSRTLGNVGSNDFWHSKKPDLPGRVSFGKVTSLNTIESIDYSDYENDNLENEKQLNDNNSTRITTAGSSSATSVNKKSVHFGERTEVDETIEQPTQQQQKQEQDQQHQQTSSSSASSSTCHQYTSSSCSNENCPCVCTKKSPRLKSISYTIPISTPSVSQQNTTTTTTTEYKCCSDNKCTCEYNDGATKNLTRNFTTDFTSFDVDKQYKEERNSSRAFSSKDEGYENLIIQNYKDQMNDESKKLQLEIKMLEDRDKDIDCSSIGGGQQHNLSRDFNSNNDRLSTLLNADKDNDRAADIISKYETEYTQIENSSKLQLGQKNNFSYLHVNANKDNNNVGNLDNNQQMINKDKMTQTFNPIINNYLKVSESVNITSNSNQQLDDHQSKLISKEVKKLNNNTTMNSQQTKRSKKAPSSTSTCQSKKNSRSKSVSPGIKPVTSTTSPKKNVSSAQLTLNKKQKNIKKSETFGCLRQNSILDEFHLDDDNIDSWMTIKDENYHHNQKKHHQIQEQYNLHHHHHHYHKGKADKDGGDHIEMDDGRNRNQSRQRYSTHCHRYEETHYDTDTPELCSKTTEETTSASTSSSASSASSSQDGCCRENGNGSSTYDEIVSVIKEIEEEKKKEMPHESSIDLDIKFQSLLHSDGTSDISTTRKDENESPDKLKDILNYLEDVENSCERTLMETTRRSMPETNRSEVEFAVEPDIAENVPKIADLLMIPNHQLARRVVALSLRANELSNAVQLSKENLAQIRKEKQKMIRIEKQNTANRLREQKKYYENMLTRHQGFIEQLLKDKGSLCEKVTALTRRLESQNQACEHRLETEVARAKELALAGEKIRREKWVRENTKKIKELTVKGLEGEIEKMNSDHKKEIAELKRQHQQELSDALQEARQKHEQVEKSIRETCAKDRETIIEKERTAIRERFEKQLHEEQKSFDEQKIKLLEDFAAERERLLKDLRQKDGEFEKKRQEMQREKELALEQIIAECNEKLEQQEQKHQLKISAIEKQFESDFLIWKREFENACKLREVENENSIRQHYRAERDRQIDAIVSRMDAESQKCQEEFELKLSRLKDKYECDLKEVENSEKSLREKYNEIRTKLAESDAQVQNLNAELKQLQLELDHSKKMCDEFLAEKESMKENARNEVQAEIATIKNERDEEIQKIHKRVQQAIEKKDVAIEILQKDNATLRERCIKLESIIRQQRKDYCIK